MKKQINVLIFSLLLLISSCVTYISTPHIGEITYANWKAEQKAANDALLKYTQSDYYQRTYHGKNTTIYSNSPNANSVVGTKNDPFAGVRNTSNIPPSASSQYYRIIFR